MKWREFQLRVAYKSTFKFCMFITLIGVLININTFESILLGGLWFILWVFDMSAGRSYYRMSEKVEPKENDEDEIS